MHRFGFFEEDLRDEMLRAIEKHGKQQTPINSGMPSREKLVILVEEIGEVARAMTYDEGSNSGLKSELLQVAAMAGMWYISMMTTEDLE